MHCAACCSRLITAAAVNNRSGRPPPAPSPQPVANRRWHHTLALRCVAGVLSLSLFNNTHSLGLAHEIPANYDHPKEQETELEWMVAEKCEEQTAAETAPELATSTVSNEEIVDEAWSIVNDSFINSGNSNWDPERWRQKREEVLRNPIRSRSRAHDIIKRMLASAGDPYTRFLTPSEFSRMAKYDLTGVGINLREVDGEDGSTKLKVLGIVLGGPAHTAGVRQGDELLSVNGESVEGKTAFVASSLLQGPKETYVTVEVKHPDCGQTETIRIQRQVTARTPVLYRVEPMEDGKTIVGYIRLKEFNALARKDLIIALKNLQDSGASYFLLDLRDNLGGLVQAGIEVAKLFLDEGNTVIYTVGRDPQVQQSITADSTPLVTVPVMVLVNNHTASASEIVATALHDNCKAVLVGERTFGKGLIQSVFELHDGSGVVVTVGKYVTPNHVDINGNGVQPDFLKKPDWNEVAKRLASCRLHNS
ncbi:carboxyl-terminal-processing peptidase 1, chloroplastic-like isoform X1 [Nymphaea colorata]|nr:carboxyl-terminal-processing peptidase 1, chloroplastic-like isoform X1 [Nymphaea colorata]XP_031500921.1 carboxyl-terminal-processing peptidase 1, chloroplastic-like isoform X1 [Nymphaea colorata]XP_031500922.1 carboxyl-terminal-processing peptidase 1, chloroplastic-like isoform X1 [Nymphaea colorata]